MAEVVLFHHAQGLTSGVRKFADDLRAEGHTVHTPDLYNGVTFTDLDEGVGNARKIGFDKLLERAKAAVDVLPDALVYGGFSMGVGAAQMLAQTRPGAKGALLFYGALPVSEFGPWPQGVPLQIHAMRDDPWFKEDAAAARELAATVEGAELFLYPGDRHLFADNSLPDYDEAAAKLALERALSFLEKV
jgi:dienelactone hydrolase